MPRLTLTCRDCHEEFLEKPPGSRGYRNQCPDCSEKQAEPEPIGGNMIWEHKTGPYCELKPLGKAKEFAQKTRRQGAGVTSSLVTPKEPKRGFGEE